MSLALMIAIQAHPGPITSIIKDLEVLYRHLLEARDREPNMIIGYAGADTAE
jgi:hypothetical protein